MTGGERRSKRRPVLVNLLNRQLVAEDIGDEIFALAVKICPICRGVTGNRQLTNPARPANVVTEIAYPCREDNSL